jgi:hypothetical protein
MNQVELSCSCQQDYDPIHPLVIYGPEKTCSLGKLVCFGSHLY